MTTAILQKMEFEFEQLGKERLSAGARRNLQTLQAQMQALSKQIEDLRKQLGLFSPEAAAERIVAEMQAAEGGAWPDAEFRRKFHLSSAVLHRRRKEHRIVYWRDARNGFHYPKWQFTETGAPLPGIQDILQTFQSQDEWRIMRYFLGPRKQLDGQRPLDLLKAGRLDKVLAHAQTHAAENTW
jgi:hypothetical protein